MADTKTNDRAIPKSRDRAILVLAIPSVIASLSVPVIGIVDTVLVGHLDEVYMLGAVSVGAVVFDVIFWGLGFFRMGTTALVAQSYGAKDFAGCRSILLMSAVMAGLLGVLLLLLRDLIGDLGFGLAGPTDEVTHWGRLYLNIRILGAPFVLITFVTTGFLRGCGDAISPLILTVVVNLVNVGLDFVLIYGHLSAPAMGVVGAAWASAAAGFVGAVVGGALIFYRHRGVITQKGRIFDPVRARQVIATNGNLFGRTACLLFTQFFGMAVVSRMGDTPLAAHAIAWQIWSIVSYFVDGFAHAAETLVGNALGGRDRGQAIAFARRCMVWGSGIGLAFGIGYLVSVPFLAGLFTDHAPVIAQVTVLTALLSLMQPVGGAVYILDGILIGANDTRFLFFAMAVGAFAVYLPVILVGGTLLPGLVGVWVAYNALMLTRFSMLWVRFRGRRWLPEDKAISLDTPTGCI